MYTTYDLDANRSDIIEACRLDEVSKYGTVMEYEEFMECAHCKAIMDYDGDGYLIIGENEVSNSDLHVDDRFVRIAKQYDVPFEKLHEVFGNDIKFIWFNK